MELEPESPTTLHWISQQVLSGLRVVDSHGIIDKSSIRVSRGAYKVREANARLMRCMQLSLSLSLSLALSLSLSLSLFLSICIYIYTYTYIYIYIYTNK